MSVHSQQGGYAPAQPAAFVPAHETAFASARPPEFPRHIVTAVLEDLPPSRFATPPIGSAASTASFSALRSLETAPWSSEEAEAMLGAVQAFVRFAPGASAAQFDQVLPQLLERAWPRKPSQTPFGQAGALGESHRLARRGSSHESLAGGWWHGRNP